MRNKIFEIFKKVYGWTMFVGFFAGILPLIPFIVAICIGGETGANISNFLYKQYYPWVLAIASIAILIGLIGMYVGGKQGLSVKKINVSTKKESK